MNQPAGDPNWPAGNDSTHAADQTQLPDDPAAAAAALGIDAGYSNDSLLATLAPLQNGGGYPELAAFLQALREGFLIVDITGTNSKKKGPRARTIRATNGQQVLPLFTSMAELRRAARNDGVKGAVMPAAEALALVRGGTIAGIELNPGSAKLVLLRKFVEFALDEPEITAARLEAGI
ncbi:MAG: SseB family protein [Microbacteriaceae bacterium]|nr:SseB family protein [Microbacteriaceae bacterium]